MINQLLGTVVQKFAGHVVLDVHGVGYDIELTMGAFFSLPAEGETVTICTHFLVREDAMLLYGFSDVNERSLFRELLRVSGIGPKVALGVLSSIDSTELANCVRDGNSAMLTQIPGIGKKTAERVVVELRDRLDKWGSETGAIEIKVDHKMLNEAEEALIALGYKVKEVGNMLTRAKQDCLAKGDGLSTQTLITYALKTVIR